MMQAGQRWWAFNAFQLGYQENKEKKKRIFAVPQESLKKVMKVELHRIKKKVATLPQLRFLRLVNSRKGDW